MSYIHPVGMTAIVKYKLYCICTDNQWTITEYIGIEGCDRLQLNMSCYVCPMHLHV